MLSRREMRGLLGWVGGLFALLIVGPPMLVLALVVGVILLPAAATFWTLELVVKLIMKREEEGQ